MLIQKIFINIFTSFFCAVVVSQIQGELPKVSRDVDEIRHNLHVMSEAGRLQDVIRYLDVVEDEFGTLLIDGRLPSLYNFKGVAHYGSRQSEEAKEAFKNAVSFFPEDVRAWINLGEIQVQLFELRDAIASFSRAYEYGDVSALPRMLRTEGWSAEWRYFEQHTSAIEKFVVECLEQESPHCEIDAGGGLEYTELPNSAYRMLSAQSPNSRDSNNKIPPALQPVIRYPTKKSGAGARKQRLKVGLISSDFGVHPVATLIRGLVQFIDRDEIELFCFAIYPKVSWWGVNITNTVEHFVWLQNLNNYDAAVKIAELGVEILIDLNGHTMNSGLPIMSHRPSPIQISFLGLPSTTGASFIDYFIGDRVSLPPEHHEHFSEKLLLMNPTYIVNDYAQVQGDILQFHGDNRAARNAFDTPIDLSAATTLFATLSNSQKVDPSIFHVWMNILRRHEGAKLLFMEYAGKDVYMQNYYAHAAYHGIRNTSIVQAAQTPWIDHLYVKTSVDLVLDTIAKNGHTTGLDGVWAGVPTISLGGGKDMPARAAESISESMESSTGIVYSLKEYEDLVNTFIFNRKIPAYSKMGNNGHEKIAERSKSIDERENNGFTTHTHINDIKSCDSTNNSRFEYFRKNISGNDRLRMWRNHVEDVRNIGRRYVDTPLQSGRANLTSSSPIAVSTFDTRAWTRSFTRLLQATWESNLLTKKRISRKSNTTSTTAKYHIFFSKPETFVDSYKISTSQVFSEESAMHSSDPKRRVRISVNTYSSSDHESGSDNNKDRSDIVHNSGSGSGQDGVLEKKSDGEDDAVELVPIPMYVFDGRLIMLNIGGIIPRDGWLIVNSQVNNFGLDRSVDIVRKMNNIVGLGNGSVSAIYASHTLEHNSFGDKSLDATLKEWFRLLRPGGILFVSVPDLTTLAKMYLDPSLSLKERWMVTMMIFGAQSDKFDYHYVGFNEDTLTYFLTEAGFCKIERVGNFNLGFGDTSEYVYLGYTISLNMVAKKCPILGDYFDGFEIDHNADPYVRN